jgi:hypothetical protein
MVRWWQRTSFLSIQEVIAPSEILAPFRRRGKHHGADIGMDHPAIVLLAVDERRQSQSGDYGESHINPTGYPLDSPDPNLLCRPLFGFCAAD